MREADEVVQSVGSIGGALSGPVAVGCYSTLAPTVLPPLLEGFGRANPSLELGIDISGLDAGSYTFVASTDDPSGGEGGGPTVDTKDFTVG